MRLKSSACATLLAIAASALIGQAQPQAKPQTNVRIGVLGLFHPRQLEIEQGASEPVAITAPGSAWLLNGEPGHRRLMLHADAERVVAEDMPADAWKAASRAGAPVRFQLIVPGKLRRTYNGRLSVEARHGELIAVVSMSLETAVASIVAAEMPADAPLEALKAQAVVARSYLAVGSRHHDFDFCDTTHCQFLRSPPDAGNAAGKATVSAVNATRGMILIYHQKPLAAMYSSRCGGSTHSLRELGIDPHENYPYYSVLCAWCRHHPSQEQRIGYSVIGHSVGMCQLGAIGMATTGSDFKTILSHYYPNSELRPMNAAL